MPDLIRECEQRITQALNPGNSPDFKDVFQTLSNFNQLTTKLTGDPNAFAASLKQINDDLHKLGLLPHLDLVMDGQGPGATFALAQDSDNPQGSAIVSRSGAAPQESAQEQNDYGNMGYNNGWQDSAAGGGGADGHVNRGAAVASVPEGKHADLIKQALKLAGAPVTDENVAAVNTIVEKESGWNPNAINLTDSNASAGHPSQGLMQTIPGTFKENALPGYDSNINDPLSNLVAGIRYSQKRYGGVQNVPGVQAVANGNSYVGY